ncbi:amino acid ABC transporter permease [Aestuariivirga sp.]|uniref:amino acid ABC transporter permease n=1 Tax=Aestuariivirga sp. TaxID=2650926 RepID=UPI0039E66D4E
MTSPQPHVPKPADGLAIVALLFAALCVFVAIATTSLVRASIAGLGATSSIHEIIFAAVIAATAALFWPAIRGLMFARKAAAALKANDIVTVRIDTAAARDTLALTFGWGVFALLVLGFAAFIFMNNSAVGRTFFLLPLIADKWPQVFAKFVLVNIFVFVVAEIIVLVWGLFMALARMMPGPAGRPIRALATLYCDVFRGLPAIVTLYLIGFGIPTSGLPEIVIPAVYGLFHDTSTMSVQELRDLSRIPVVWWCILALTLTYGAYVAEVYRAGIESIHWSQVSAARSLGLSYLQTMRYVVVPQAVRRVVAPLLNDFIGLQKDTALVQILGLVDAFNASRGIAANAFNLSAVTIVAILFVLITIPQARLVDHLVERDNQRMKAGG